MLTHYLDLADGQSGTRPSKIIQIAVLLRQVADGLSTTTKSKGVVKALLVSSTSAG